MYLKGILADARADRFRRSGWRGVARPQATQNLVSGEEIASCGMKIGGSALR